MNEEEKKAIKVLEQYKQECIEEYKIEIDNVEENIDQQHASYLHQQIEATYTVLNLITKLQKENEELKATVNKQSIDISNNLLELQQKDKQIDLMAEYIDEIDVSEVICGEKIICDENCKDCIKQYFEIKAKKGE